MPEVVRSPLLSLAALAGVFGLSSPSAARRLAIREGIPTVRIGRKCFVRAVTLDAWLEARESAATPAAAAPSRPSPVALALLRKGRTA